MKPRPLLLAMALLPPLLAGCIGTDPDDQTATSAQDGAGKTGDDPGDAAPEANPTPDADAPGAAPAVQGPWSGTAIFKIAGACVSPPAGGLQTACVGAPSSVPGEVSLRAAAKGLTLDATWTPTDPGFAEMTLALCDAEGTLHEQTGPSPLTLAIPDLAPGDYTLVAKPAGLLVAGDKRQEVAWTMRASG